MALKFSANLSMLYREVPFLDRFARAAEAGFSVVEVQFPYEAGVQNVNGRLDSLGLTLSLFNLPPGDAQLGEWGFLSNPAKRDYFQQGFDMALEAARLLKCQRLNTMYGQKLPGVDPKEQRDCACENLAWAAPQAEQAGVTLLIEPLNPTDFPNYALQQTAAALDLAETGGPCVGQASVRCLSCPDDRRQPDQHVEKQPRLHRPHPGRRRAGSAPAGHGRDQLRSHFCLPGRNRLSWFCGPGI